MVSDPHDEAEKIYEQILDLLEQLHLLYAEGGDTESDDAEDVVPVIHDHDIVELMTEGAGERGMDEEAAERVFKAISQLAKKAKEQ